MSVSVSVSVVEWSNEVISRFGGSSGRDTECFLSPSVDCLPHSRKSR